MKVSCIVDRLLIRGGNIRVGGPVGADKDLAAITKGL